MSFACRLSNRRDREGNDILRPTNMGLLRGEGQTLHRNCSETSDGFGCGRVSRFRRQLISWS